MTTRNGIAIVILGLVACGQDEATIQYTVNAPEPAAAVLQLDVFAVHDGQRDGSSSTMGDEPLVFPQVGSMSWFDERARGGPPVQICAVGHGDDGTFAGASSPVYLAVDQTLDVSLTLAALADGTAPAAPCDLPAP